MSGAAYPELHEIESIAAQQDSFPRMRVEIEGKINSPCESHDHSL